MGRKRLTFFVAIVFICSAGFFINTYAYWLPVYRLPSIDALLANPVRRPIPVEKIYENSESKTLDFCINISRSMLMKTPSSSTQDLWRESAIIEKSFDRSFTFVVDGYKQNHLGFSMKMLEEPFFRCLDTSHFAKGLHVAYIEFDSAYGQHYSYTWVFEVKAEGVVPEVTATNAP
jgi:hypothetical protein